MNFIIKIHVLLGVFKKEKLFAGTKLIFGPIGVSSKEALQMLQINLQKVTVRSGLWAYIIGPYLFIDSANRSVAVNVRA